MKEYFDTDEYKKIDEYKELKAENYSNINESFIGNEFKNNIDEFLNDNSSSSSINNNNKALDSEEFNNKYNKELNQNTNNTLEADSSSITTSSTEATISNAISTTGSSIAGTIGTVATTAIGAVGAVAIASNFLLAAPQMDIISLDIGCDYVHYVVEVSDLDLDSKYSIIIENGYNKFVCSIEEGTNENIVTGLKPYCEYKMSLVVDNKELGGEITYNSESFYTKKPESPTAAFKYNLNPDFENSLMNLNYNIFISDYYQEGYDYYYTISYADEIVYQNDDLSNDYYFNGSISSKEGDYQFNVYCRFFDEDIVILDKTVTVKYPEGLIKQDVDYGIDNVNITGDLSSGYNLEVKLENYFDTAEYELLVSSNNFSQVYKLEKDNIIINDLMVDYDSLELELMISYYDETYTHRYSINDFTGFSLEYSEPIFNNENNNYSLECIIDNDYEIDYVIASNNYGESERIDVINNIININICGDVKLEAYIKGKDLEFINSQNIIINGNVYLKDIRFGDNNNPGILRFKTNEFLPDNAKICARMGNDDLEEIEYLDDYYYIDLSSYDNINEITLYAIVNNEEIIINDCNINLENVSYPSFSKENININDCYVSYNDDGSYNTYLPICFNNIDDVWYQVILNDNIYYEGNDYIPIITNLDKIKNYNISLGYYYRYNGISYLLESVMLNNLNIVIENNYLVEYDSSDGSGKFSINNFNYDVSNNATIHYTDDSNENITLEFIDNTITGNYDISKEISYVSINYSYKLVDEELLNNNNINIIGTKYQEMNIYANQLFNLEINEIIYNDYDSSNKLLISSNLDNNYSLVIEQNGEIINYEEYNNGYYIFNVENITLDNSFNIRLIENDDFIKLSKKHEYTIISDTSTISIPTYSNNFANPGDCYITYNEDGTINTYLPINFTSDSIDIWYRIKLVDVVTDEIHYIEGSDYYAVGNNLSNSRYSITYQIYYRYNGISYYINGEYPSGVIEDLDSSGYEVSYDPSVSNEFTIDFYYPVLNTAVINYTDGSSEEVTISSDGITITGNYTSGKLINYITISYSTNLIDEDILNSHNILLVGNKYNTMNIYPNEVLELEINEMVYDDYDGSKNLLIKSNINISEGYSMYLSQEKADEVIEVTSTSTIGQYLVFDTSTLTLDSPFDIKIKKNSTDVILTKAFEYTIISDTSTLNIPTYSYISSNPGDCYITYNDDGTINTYLPINFTSDSRDIWYHIELTDVMTDVIYYLDGSDYYAVGSNLANLGYSITYQIYYRYNGISYYINGEYPSGVIEDLDSSGYEVSYDPSVNNEFTIIDFYYPVLNNAVINYTDGSSEEVTISSDGIAITGNYTSGKLINYITINYSTNLIDEDILNSHNISLVGNKYKTMNIYSNEILELEINEIVYDDYDGSKNLLIKSNINISEGYSMYLSQEKADEVIEVTSTSTIGQYLVFDTSTLTLDSPFDIKIKKNSTDVILTKAFEYTIISDTSTLNIPTYSNITPNPGDCYITYNEDETFNAYLPMNFTSDSRDIWYRIKLTDVENQTNYYLEGRDYIASAKNLNNSSFYSIIYQIYYRYNGVSYYITGEWPSGTITGTLDTSSTTLSIDSETSQFTINNFYYNYLEEVTVKYTDGSSEVVTVDSTYSTGNYDNTKEIASIVVNACEKVITTEFEETLSSNNIVLVGNKYKEIEITNS